jgi:hypothetical protein
VAPFVESSQGKKLMLTTIAGSASNCGTARQSEDARWEKQKEKLQAAVRRAREI